MTSVFGNNRCRETGQLVSSRLLAAREDGQQMSSAAVFMPIPFDTGLLPGQGGLALAPEKARRIGMGG